MVMLFFVFISCTCFKIQRESALAGFNHVCLWLGGSGALTVDVLNYMLSHVRGNQSKCFIRSLKINTASYALFLGVCPDNLSERGMYEDLIVKAFCHMQRRCSHE